MASSKPKAKQRADQTFTRLARPQLDRPWSDREFVGRVRRHAPSSLIPLIARRGAENATRESWLDANSRGRPWELAEIARVSLTRGTEFRPPASDEDLDACIYGYRQINDPDLHHHREGAVGEFLLRTAAEQLTYQQEIFHDLARTVALFEHTTATGDEPKVLKGAWANELFGCSIGDYVNTAFLLYIGAMRNEGIFDPAWLDQRNFEPIVEQIPAAVMTQLMESQFVADKAQLQRVQAEVQERIGRPAASYRRFGFNPLSKYPVVSGFADRWHIPVPHLLILKASCLGIFYAGLDRWGKTFADDLGPLFESYIGNQLADLGGTVIPEIQYDHDNKRSVDWLVILDECVLLVEVKSTRPTEKLRWGGPEAGAELERTLAKGVGQLDKTAQLIRDGHAAFDEVPKDRPIIGLVVTMEPFSVANTPFLSSLLSTVSIPYRICSAQEIEGLVRLAEPTIGAQLHAYMIDPERTGHSIKPLMEGRPLRDNPILQSAWDSFVWRDPDTGPVVS